MRRIIKAVAILNAVFLPMAAQSDGGLGGWRRADTFLERVRAVTPADVQRVARTYLKGVRFAVVGDSTKIDRALFTSM